MIRGVEIEQRLKGRSVDPEVIKVLRQLAEDNGVLRKENVMLAQTVDKLIDIFGEFQDAVGKSLSEQIKLIRGGDYNDSSV